MLRKHLERLEQPLGSEDNVERDQSPTPQEEDTGYDENGMHNNSIFSSYLFDVFFFFGRVSL